MGRIHPGDNGGRLDTESEDRYRLLVELSPDGHIVHQQGRTVYANSAALTLLSATAEDVLGHLITEFVAPASREAMLARIKGLTTPGLASEPSELSLLRRDGSTLQVETVSVPTRWLGEPAFQVILRDLTREREAELRRRLAEERYTSAVAALDEGVILIDGTGHVESSNPAALAFLAVSAEELLGARLVEAVEFLGSDGDAILHEVNPAEMARVEGEHRDPQNLGIRQHNGTLLWLSVSARTMPVRDADPGHPVVLTLRDVTDKLATAARMEHEARHDDLTGLANRRLVLERLTKLNDDRPRPRAAVLFIDVDRFKAVNDSLGHDAGDRVLIEIGERLRRAGGPAEVIGRLAGDEFIFVASGIADPSDARALARRLLEVISRPIDIDGRAVIVTASVGVAMLNGTRYDRGEEILRDADVAMYQAKQEAHPRVLVFDQALRVAAVHRLEMEVGLRQALRSAQIWPAFQPLLTLADRRVVAVEALARWDHPLRGPVSPAEFIPIAEEAGLIVQLGEQILREACTRTAAWHAEPGLAGLGVSVNISTRQFASTGLADMISQTLQRTGLPPTDLILEITESVLMHDPAGAANTLVAIKELGVRLALDDFGTGFSSLAYLRRFPVDTVKIDQGFIRDICESSADRAIVTSMIRLAHTLGLTVTAEGVEHQDQHEVLGELGCDTVQGFLYARPVPAADLPTTIARLAAASGH